MQVEPVIVERMPETQPDAQQPQHDDQMSSRGSDVATVGTDTAPVVRTLTASQGARRPYGDDVPVTTVGAYDPSMDTEASAASVDVAASPEVQQKVQRVRTIHDGAREAKQRVLETNAEEAERLREQTLQNQHAIDYSLDHKIDVCPFYR